MDSDLELNVHWSSVKDTHVKLMHREPQAHAQRGPDSSSSGPAPWAAEGRSATAAPVHDRWAGAVGSATSNRWQDWQEWNSWGHQKA
eukprot:6376410-Pyramimonas_sp.AAC.1